MSIIKIADSNEGLFLFSGIGAFLYPTFQYLYGESEVRITVALLLFLLLALDWISGSNASSKDGSYASEYGITGIWRTIFILMVPISGNFIDIVLSVPGVFFGLFTAGLIYHIGKSSVANAVRAGWANWLPISIFEMVFEWAKSEIEHKAARAFKRNSEKSEVTINYISDDKTRGFDEDEN